MVTMKKQICYGDIEIDKKMMDDLFNLIINKSPKIPQNFYELIEKLEFNYTPDILKSFKSDKIEMLKVILYALYQLEIENFQNILYRVKREDLINMYNLCKTYNTDNFLSYYKKTIINKYTDNST